MTFANIMVHIEPEHANDACLQVALECADTFNAKLIGIAAATGPYDGDETYYQGPQKQYVSISPSDWHRPKTVFDLGRPRERLNGARQQRGQLSTFRAKRAPLILS